MDAEKAKDLVIKLKGRTIKNWTVDDFIDNGKSAAVFKATDVDTGEVAALKIFDDELIQRYGDSSQIARIERELDLIGDTHPNMVKIIDGGVDEETNNHFIVMEYLNGENLKNCLNEIPIENISDLVSQLANCAEFLEKKELVHRDIKPENILITEEYNKLILLDFGVLRPIGDGSLTDDDGIQPFVGTLQYSSPEFLLREEVDDLLGWRALTFYQIGAVMHDLIMRKEIFSESIEPYARLVNAVQRDIPIISNSSVPNYLIETARACLSKKTDVRTNLLDWSSFHPPAQNADLMSGLKHSVSARTTIMREHADNSVNDAEHELVLLDAVVNHLKSKTRSIRNANSSALPPVSVTLQEDEIQICFNGSENHALKHDILIRIKIEILDVKVDAIALHAVPQIGELMKSENVDFYPIYKGISTSETIAQNLEKCIYLTVDHAQRNSDTGSILNFTFKDFA